jgi:hypothetical protein
MQSGSKNDHFDPNLLTDLAVVLNYIADIIESEIHCCGVIDVNLYDEPMWLRSDGARGHLGVYVHSGRSPGRTIDFYSAAGLGAQRQDTPNGGHAGEDDE